MSIPPNDFALIESVIGKLPAAAQEDARTLFQGWSAQHAVANKQLGIASGSNAKNMAAPPAAALQVSGANGAFNVSIANPATPATLWHEVSYAPTKGFNNNVTTLEPTTATGFPVNLPGETHFFRIRSSYNKVIWNDHVLAANTAVSSGLVSSAATNSAGAFNQTNYMNVTSAPAAGGTQVTISGAGGILTSGVALKGGVETILPAASVVGAALGSSFVGWDGKNYQLKPTLAGVFEDGLTPIGKASGALPGGGGAAGGNGGRMTNV